MQRHTRDDLDGPRARDPLTWFLASLEGARAREPFDATRAALATVSAAGAPSVRFVLVKLVDARGFTFFTNYQSAKARDLTANPRAALAFHWSTLGEQVRVQGIASRIADQESDAYFASRPRESQLGAWASAQSMPIDDRAALDAQLKQVTQRFEGSTQIPRPPHWGGYRIAADVIEFWRDRAGRLHDRFRFTRDAHDASRWSLVRLQP